MLRGGFFLGRKKGGGGGFQQVLFSDVPVSVFLSQLWKRGDNSLTKIDLQTKLGDK
jgi:hypothetical protein